ncbi:MAG: hypothetical protein ACR2N7_04855, partial [Acidimicrobiia bacterium]
MTASQASPAKTTRRPPLSWRRYLLLLPLLVVLLGVLTIAIELGSNVPDSDQVSSTDIIWIFTYAVAAGTGAVILIYVPSHLVGRYLLGYGLCGSVAFTSFAVAVLLAESGSPNGAAAAEAFSAAIISAGFLFLPASLLVFPTGTLPSRRWRVVVWVMVAAAVSGGAAALVTGGFGGDLNGDTTFGPGPLTDQFGELAAAVSNIFFLGLFVSLVATALSLVVRFRGSSGDERLQIKWVATAGVFLVLSTVLNGPSEVSGSSEVILALGLAAVPVSMAVAIIKYRLFDIDVVIKRSITFGVLVVFIGVMYVAIVVGVGELLGDR